VLFAGVVDQHVEPLVFNQDLLKRLLPGSGLCHVQINAGAIQGIFPGQLFGLFASRMNSQPNEILRRFFQERLAMARPKPPLAPVTRMMRELMVIL